MARFSKVNGLDVEAITKAVIAQVMAATSPTPSPNRRTRRAFMHNTATAPAPIAAPTIAPSGAAKHLATRQARILNTTAASVTTPNTQTASINLPANVLDEARKYALALDAAWEAWRKGGKADNLRPNIDNPNLLLSQVEVLDILGQVAPDIHKLCFFNPQRGPWLWVPTELQGKTVLPKHPDVRAFLKWLGFEWVGGQKMWLHKVNHHASGKFRPGTHNLKSELAPVK